MNLSLDYLKKILKVLIWPILFWIGQFLIIFIFTIVFNVSLNMDVEKLQDYVTTTKYQNDLAQFFTNNSALMMIITTAIFLPIFINVYKKIKTNSIKINLNIKDYIVLILLGISIYFTFNIAVKYINDIFNITDLYSTTRIKFNMLAILLCTGIVGPIIEEILFRGIVYNKIKAFNNQHNAMILSSLLFAVMHNDYIHTIYAFLISIILIYAYEKYQTIKAPIIIHVIANICNIFFLDLIVDNSIIINCLLLIGMIFVLIVCFKKIKPNYTKK